MSLAAAIAATTLSGALYGLAFPPVGWWPLAWVALAPFLIAVRMSTPRRALGLGVLLGVVASFGVGTWMPDAVIRYYEQPITIGVAVFLACALLQASWQYAGFAWIYRRLARRGGTLSPVLVGAAWTAAELARAKPAVGNPWALLGYSQTAVPLIVQTADLAGVFGIGFLLAAVNAVVAAWWTGRRDPQARSTWGAMLLVFVLVAATLLYGVVAIRAVDADRTTPPVPIAAVQGNLDLGVQWKPEFYGANLDAYARLTLAATRERPARLVVWPESALTFFLESEPAYQAYLRGLLTRTDAELITGGPRVIDDGAGGKVQYRNAAFVVTSAGTMAATYEKRFLVPFAEYFPFPRLDLLRREFGRVREFTPGTLQAPLPTVAGPVGITICNESMLAEGTIDRVRSGAEWLVTLSNDSWVGRRQYADIALEMGRLRAVEVRRWLVRASTSGPSAVIDPAGRIVDRLAFDTRGVVRGELVPRRGLTVYARSGDAFAWACLLVTVVFALAPLGKRSA